MQDKNIECGILVTSALPKNSCKLEGHIERHGKRIMIVPMDYRIIHTLVSSIMLATLLVNSRLLATNLVSLC